ncbi:MAG TPA: glycosyl hydrolase family 18 protein, partial [Candidatus Limnocylindrales bacterium]
VLVPFATVTGAEAASPKAPKLRPLTSKQVAHRLTGEVYGFLPYWLETPKTAGSLQYKLLTTISLFDIGLKANGGIDHSWVGYRTLMNATSTSIIAAAHAAGDRVDVTLASFGYLQNRAFLRNKTDQRRAIRQIVALLAARGLDGVTVDFESVYLRDLPDFSRFVDSLERAIRAHNKIGRVTVAVNGSTTGAAMAAAAFAGHADRVLIMGYDYRSSRSSTTGSTDPLVVRGGGMSLTWTLTVFKAGKLPMNKIILALPYYGMSWPTTSAKPGTAPAHAAYGKAPAYPIQFSKIKVPKGSRHGYDKVEATAWVATYDAHLHVWRQTFYDSPASLTAKYNLAKSRGLAGVGMWALGYDAGATATWQALAKAFQPPPPKKVKAKKHTVHHATPKPKAIHKPKAVHKPKPKPHKPAPVKKPIAT